MTGSVDLEETPAALNMFFELGAKLGIKCWSTTESGELHGAFHHTDGERWANLEVIVEAAEPGDQSCLAAAARKAGASGSLMDVLFRTPGAAAHWRIVARVARVGGELLLPSGILCDESRIHSRSARTGVKAL